MTKPNTLMGFPVHETADLPSPQSAVFGDWSSYIVPITLPLSTPIADALVALGLPDATWTGVRTLGDLLVAIERGEVDDAAVLKALGLKRRAKNAAASD